ncbi:MAG: tRNA preQ1(34) S-adenosylmethionine ribosyltransferase-isomerase QueA [Erysipelotrichaceae bacterium]|nr:tRNA preQ1(34) S-adenosylmethionine ribosyltransferase-isomerase QueA [Erysipelotrichaceae bacterium]
MKLDLFDYYLPEHLIAQYPSNKREQSRLLVVNKTSKTYEDKTFVNIIDYLNAGDVLVRNNTKVIPARLVGYKVPTGAKVEVLLLRNTEGTVYECLCGNAKTVKLGTKLVFGNDGLLEGECIEVKNEGIRMIKFAFDGVFMEILEQLATIPLPPYIEDKKEKYARYQTVYAKVLGSAAAPTAGFHFSEQLLEEIKAKGVEIVDITLNIGLDTFRPVKVENTSEHKMHSEYYAIEEEVANLLNSCKKTGRRIIAVGTTAVRTLEANFKKHGRFAGESSETDIFITPGYKFEAIDCLLTNFHLPKSTLLMLVSAYAGREFVLECYNYAVRSKYRFFSFGDAMFIHG